jgi:acetylornithine/succinyldiaminopimelate/putrescine aminotransferase
VKIGFDPLPQVFTHVPFNDPRALEKAMHDKICAVMVEPIQGEGGVRIPSSDYLEEIHKICQKHHALLIFDEIQTGLGRTGKLFAYEHSGVVPDILTLAKSLGAGFPIGACLATDEVAQAFTPGSHATTFGGNYLACAAAKAFLQTLLQNNFLNHVQEVGKYFLNQLHQLKKKYPVIEEVRGQGLMIGIDLSIPAKPIVEKGLQEGLVLNSPQEKTLRILPPLIVTQKEIDEAIQIMDRVFAEIT